MRSLRRRLLLGTAIGTAAVLSGAGFMRYAMMRASLFASFDAALLERAHTLAGMIEQDGREIEPAFTEADMVEFRRPNRPEYFQVWLADGTVVARSPSSYDERRDVRWRCRGDAV